MGQTKIISLRQPRAVTRTGEAADLATAHLFDIFTIAGGPVLIQAIIGRSRAAVEGATTQTLEGGLTPTSGTGREIWAAASANTVTITDEDFIITWSGVMAAAMIVAQTGNVVGLGAVGSVLAGTSGAINIFVEGVIDITTAGDTDDSGLIDWTVIYQPLLATSVVTVL